MAERFRVLTDEHLPEALAKALRKRGFVVMRVEDAPQLGKATPDAMILDYAVQERLVWITRDARVQKEVSRRLKLGEKVPGIVCWAQKYRYISIGHVLRCLDDLSREKDPFSRIRYIKPSGID